MLATTIKLVGRLSYRDNATGETPCTNDSPTALAK